MTEGQTREEMMESEMKKYRSGMRRKVPDGREEPDAGTVPDTGTRCPRAMARERAAGSQ